MIDQLKKTNEELMKNHLDIKLQLQTILNAIEYTFEKGIQDILNVNVTHLDQKLLNALNTKIKKIDHLGVILSNNISLQKLVSLIKNYGFENYQIFKSVYISKYLGTLLNINQVDTTILKTYKIKNQEQKIGIEFFMPHHSHYLLNHSTIHHIAFEVHQLEDLASICNLFNEEKIISSHLINNQYEHSYELFCKLNNNHDIEFEFIYLK